MVAVAKHDALAQFPVPIGCRFNQPCFKPVIRLANEHRNPAKLEMVLSFPKIRMKLGKLPGVQRVRLDFKRDPLHYCNWQDANSKKSLCLEIPVEMFCPKQSD